jgi:hypothetical protein
MAENAVPIGTGLFEIVPDTSKFAGRLRSGLNSISSSMGSMSFGGMAAMGAAAVAPLVGMIDQLSRVNDEFSEMDKTATALGMGVEQLSRLEHVARMADVEFSELTIGLRFMQKNLAGAALGGKSLGDTFSRLGLNAATLANESPTDALMDIADAFSKIENPALRTQTAMAIFGKAGSKLIPLLSMTRSEMEEFAQEAEALGVVMGDEAAAKMEQYERAVKRMQDSFTGLKRAIGVEVVQQIQALAEKITSTVSSFREWASVNGPVINQISKIAIGIAEITAVLAGATGIKMLVGAFVGLVNPLTFMMAAMAWTLDVTGLIDLGIGKWMASFEIFGATTNNWMQAFVDSWVGVVNYAAGYWVDRIGEAIAFIANKFKWLIDAIGRAVAFWTAEPTPEAEMKAMADYDSEHAGKKYVANKHKGDSYRVIAAEYTAKAQATYDKAVAKMREMPEFKPGAPDTKTGGGPGLPQTVTGNQMSMAAAASYSLGMGGSVIEDTLKGIEANTAEMAARDGGID